jgi:cullin-4
MTTFRRPRQEQKLIIKGLTEIPKLPQDYAQQSWCQLETNLKELISMRKMSSGREAMYQTVSTLCNNDNGSFILSKLLDFLKTYIISEMTDLESKEVDFNTFTEHLDNHWERFQTNLRDVLSIFMFLDGDIRNKREAGIWDKAHLLYKDQLLHQKVLYERLLGSLMSLIHDERALERDNKLILQRLIQMVSKLNLYNERFFPLFIENTEKYYKSVQKVWFDSLSVSEYLHLVEKSLKKEQERIVSYLGSQSTCDNITAVETIMVKSMASNILEKGLKGLIENNKLEDLSLLYKLLKKVDELKTLDTFICAVIKETGVAIMQESNENKNLVSELLNFQEKIEVLITSSFENNIKFKYSNKKVWEEFLKVGDKIALVLAKDFDANLKKSSRIRLTEAELENRFNGMINIFKLINSKDVFEAIYFNRLAKRLLLEKSKSNDLEKSVISKLKSECGSVFILRLRNIQNDIDFSKNFNESFQKSHDCPIEFKAWVLTESGWPKASILKPNLPESLQILKDEFSKFYTGQMNKRYLVWNTSMAYCELNCFLRHGNKSLTVSFHQGIILLLFNRFEQMTLEDIAVKTALPLEVVKVEMTQLMKRCKIVMKDGEGHELRFNPDFKHRLYKITVNTFQLKETLVETRETIEKVLSERAYIIDAAIVRIMKSRRKLQFKDLLNEVFTNIRFDVSTADVKKRIDTLIEREFISRDEDDKNIFHYIT